MGRGGESGELSFQYLRALLRLKIGKIERFTTLLHSDIFDKITVRFLILLLKFLKTTIGKSSELSFPSYYFLNILFVKLNCLQLQPYCI
jgi:hypothetical protein